MLPTPNKLGVDLDDQYYDIICADVAKEHDVDVEDVDTEVRILLVEVGQFGFSVLG